MGARGLYVLFVGDCFSAIFRTSLAARGGLHAIHGTFGRLMFDPRATARSSLLVYSYSIFVRGVSRPLTQALLLRRDSVESGSTIIQTRDSYDPCRRAKARDHVLIISSSFGHRHANYEICYEVCLISFSMR